MDNTTKRKELKIATLNVCLGLKNKQIEVERLLVDNNIGILCLQEVEVENNLDPKLLSLKNFHFELDIVIRYQCTYRGTQEPVEIHT